MPHHGTLLRVSKDGATTEILATGFRAANGVCLNPDGTFFVTDQEGFWTPKNRINWVEKGGFYGNMWGYTDVTDTSDAAMEQPLCWITNAFDRSPAELLWVTSDKWGPLKGSLLNLSYGYGKIFVVPHEKVDGQAQGGMCALPLPPFPTGVMRGAVSSDRRAALRLRHVRLGRQPDAARRLLSRPAHRQAGRPAGRPEGEDGGAGTHVHRPARPDGRVRRRRTYEVKVWGLKRSQNYGSKHIDEKPLDVAAAPLGATGKTVRLGASRPGARPGAWRSSIASRG